MNKKAFTLTEVIISVLIIAITAAGAFGSFVGAQYFLNRANHRMQAFNFAREAYERLRSNFRYTDSILEAGTDYPEANIGSIIAGEEMTNLGTVLTYDVSDSATGGYKIITVKVGWNERSFEE